MWSKYKFALFLKKWQKEDVGVNEGGGGRLVVNMCLLFKTSPIPPQYPPQPALRQTFDEKLCHFVFNIHIFFATTAQFDHFASFLLCLLHEIGANPAFVQFCQNKADSRVFCIEMLKMRMMSADILIVDKYTFG